jgi:hypothetical protein
VPIIDLTILNYCVASVVMSTWRCSRTHRSPRPALEDGGHGISAVLSDRHPGPQ